MSTSRFDRRTVLKGTAAVAAGLAAPTVLTSSAWAAYTNEPKGSSVILGFNVPQTGAYADEGADELRAYQLAVEHINGEGDGGMLNTFSSKALTGAGINGKKAEFVTGDTQTKSDAARASAKRMIEKDGAVMITGGSSSGVAIAVQGLCQDAGVIFMAGLTHSNDTTGKDRRRQRLPPLLQHRDVGRSARPGAQERLRLRPCRLPPDRRLHLGLEHRKARSRSTPSSLAGRPWRRSARRSVPATSRSTSPRC